MANYEFQGFCDDELTLFINSDFEDVAELEMIEMEAEDDE
jgi:hypothetical protein